MKKIFLSLLLISSCMVIWTACSNKQETAQAVPSLPPLPFKAQLADSPQTVALVEGNDGIKTNSFPPTHIIYPRTWQNLEGVLTYRLSIKDGKVSYIVFSTQESLKTVLEITNNIYTKADKDTIDRNIVSDFAQRLSLLINDNAVSDYIDSSYYYFDNFFIRVHEESEDGDKTTTITYKKLITAQEISSETKEVPANS